MGMEERITDLERRAATMSGSLYAIKSALVIVLSGENSSALLEHRKEILVAEMMNTLAPEEALVSMSNDFELLISALKAAGK